MSRRAHRLRPRVRATDPSVQLVACPPRGVGGGRARQRRVNAGGPGIRLACSVLPSRQATAGNGRVRERIPPMPLLLNLIYLALLVVCFPYLALRALRSGKYREGWAEKVWGTAPLRIGDRPCLWFHAVSVGEVLLLKPVIEELARRRPGWE